jgi:hypothetical protein
MGRYFLMEVKREVGTSGVNLEKLIKEVNSKVAKVGWFKESRYEKDGLPVATVAAIQEYGAPSRKIPARPFIAPTIISKKNDWMELLRKGTKSVLNGSNNFTDVLELTANKARGDIQKTISSIFSPPLSPITVLLRKWRREGRKITGATVGEAARALKSSNPPSLAGTSTKPLNDTGYMIATLESRVEKE